MGQNDTLSPVKHHPLWCDPSACEAQADDSFTPHQSASQVVKADKHSSVVIEMHLVSAVHGRRPKTTLYMEVDVGEEYGGYKNPLTYELTLPQARRLHGALTSLLQSATAG